MSRRTDPFSDLGQLFEQIQRNFEEMAGGLEGNGLALPATGSSVRIDLKEESDDLVLTAELPGFETDDIDVSLRDRTLHLEAEHEEEAEEEADGEYVRRERRRTSVARSIPLPEAVETEAIEATYNNGVLTVTMPKSEPDSDGNTIEIN